MGRRKSNIDSKTQSLINSLIKKGCVLEHSNEQLLIHQNGITINDAQIKTIKDCKTEVLNILKQDKARDVNDVFFCIKKFSHNYPNQIAIQYGNQKISYSELVLQVDKISTSLVEEGIDQFCRVGVILSRTPLLIMTMLALMQIGAIIVPFDLKIPRHRLRKINEKSHLQHVIHDSENLSLVKGLNTELHAIENCYKNMNDVIKPYTSSFSPLPSQLPVYLMYTSGTTGEPKGVVVSRQALQVTLQSLNSKLGLNQHSRMLAMASVAFDIAWFEMFGPLICGGTVVLLNETQRKKPDLICKIIESGLINIIQATPSQWKLLIQQGWQKPKNKITILSGGEALSNDLARVLFEKQGVFYSLYGPTESTIWILLTTVDENLLNKNYSNIVLGDAFRDDQIEIRNGQGELVKIGELWISGQCLAQGYYGQEMLNKNQFVMEDVRTHNGEMIIKRSYRTGDLVRRHSNGDIEFLGRIDRQVKYNGYRIELAEIEDCLITHPSISDATVIMAEIGQSKDKLLAALLVSEKGSHNKNSKKLNEYISKSLPDYMRPGRYYFLDEIPLTDNQKVDYSALKLIVKGDCLENEMVGIKNSVEGKVSQAILELLGGKDERKIGRFESFFDIGGSSMLAASLIMKINQLFNVEIPLSVVLEQPPTIALLSKLINKYKNDPDQFTQGLKTQDSTVQAA